jgi:hypothetical protein
MKRYEMRPVEISVSVFGVLVSYRVTVAATGKNGKEKRNRFPPHQMFEICYSLCHYFLTRLISPQRRSVSGCPFVFGPRRAHNGSTEPTRAPAILLTVRGGGERSGGPTAATGVSCLGEGAAATGGEQGGGGDSCRGEGAATPATDAGDFDDTPPTRAPGTCGSSTPNSRVSSFLLKHRHCVS